MVYNNYRKQGGGEMAVFSDRYGIVFQNLIDAGCDEAAAEQCAKMILDGGTEQAFRILEKHRSRLLDEVHTNQKRIDCLDYLIYKIEKSAL